MLANVSKLSMDIRAAQYIYIYIKNCTLKHNYTFFASILCSVFIQQALLWFGSIVVKAAQKHSCVHFNICLFILSNIVIASFNNVIAEHIFSSHRAALMDTALQQTLLCLRSHFLSLLTC